MARLRIGALIFAIALGLAACGGSRDRAPGTRSTGNSNRDAGSFGGFDAGITDSGAAPLDTGPSTLDPNKRLGDLSPSEQDELCAQVVAAFGTETVVCDNELEVTPPTFEECLENPIGDSTCTVREVYACVDALRGDLCRILSAPECMLNCSE